ncbi:MAG: hypothetical protein AAGC74_14025, partial [Verrucomicrobiota bacterium]
MKMKLCVLGGLAAMVLSQGVVVGEEVNFSLNYVPGKTYVTQVQMNQSATMAMGGAEMKTVMSMTIDQSQVASEHEKGVKVVSNTDGMKMNMEAGQMVMAYDSENPEGPMA